LATYTKEMRPRQLSGREGEWLILEDRLGEPHASRPARVEDVLREGIYLDGLDPLTTNYWEITFTSERPDDLTVSPSLPSGEAFLGAPPLQRVWGGEIRLDLRRFGNPGTSHKFSVGELSGLEPKVDHLYHVLYVRVSPDAVSGLLDLPLSLAPLTADGSVIESSLPFAVSSF
jgi:hypothetical protein